MQIVFYKTTTDKDHLSKTLTDALTINGTLRDSCDLLNPVIEFEYNAAILTKNYCCIPDFNRKYFVTGVVVDGKRIIVRLHVDVLSTYKTDILASRGNVVRSNQGDKYIKDNRATQTEKVYWRSMDMGPAFKSGSCYILVKGVTG